MFVKPPPFEYLTPTTLAEALDALASGDEDAKVMAGGQSLTGCIAKSLNFPTFASLVVAPKCCMDEICYRK